jgi:hypothetical protein
MSEDTPEDQQPMRLKRSEKLQLMLDEDELWAIDEWRFKHRMPSRAAAIRELLRRGLAVEQQDLEEGRSSNSYSVLDDERRRSTAHNMLGDESIIAKDNDAPGGQEPTSTAYDVRDKDD